MKGTWQTTDSSSAPMLLLVLGVLILLGSGGAVAAVSAAVIDALLAAVAVTVLTVIAGAVFVVHRARNPSPEGIVRATVVPSAVARELTGERPAIGPREVHQHYHNHFHGVDEDRVAEILRSQRPDQ